MATKYLDLDSLQTNDVTLKLNGVEHKFKEMTVGDFIWAQKEVERQKDLESEEDQFEAMTQIVRRSFPSVTREDLLNLPLAKLRALTDFVVNLSVPEEAIKAATGDEGKEATTASPS